jgi:hypothetical protein
MKTLKTIFLMGLTTFGFTLSAQAIDCNTYASKIFAERPENSQPLRWAKSILYRTYVVSCHLPMDEAAPMTSETIAAASELYTDISTGYNPYSTTVHNDLVRLTKSLRGIEAWLVRSSRTIGGGQASSEALGEIRNIINQVNQ